MNIVWSCSYTSAPRKYDTVQNAPCSFKQSTSIRNVFPFFSSKVPCKIIFTTFKCLAIVAQRGTRLGQFFRFFILTLAEAFVAYCICMWQGLGQVVFAVLVFLHSSILAFGKGGIQSSSCPGARASQDLCTPLN